MKLFIGLDVSLAKTAICVISEHGTIVKEAEVASEPEVFSRWLAELGGSVAAVGLRAGGFSGQLVRSMFSGGGKLAGAS